MLERKPRSKLGFQTQWDSGEGLLYNSLVLPTTVMGINVIKLDWWQQIGRENPGVTRIYRHHPNSDDDSMHLARWQDDPEYAAVDFVAFLQHHLVDVLPHIEVIAGDNEFILGPDHEPQEKIDKADRFMATFVREVDMVLDKGTCVGNFNTGHWGSETVQYFPRTLTAIQTQAVRGERRSFFCFHEYYYPLLRDDEHWHTGKWLRAMPPILGQYPDVQCMLTEIGIDRATVHFGQHAGWRTTHDDIQMAVDAYCGNHGLLWINNLANECEYLFALLIFGCGMVEPWRPEGFDIMNNPEDVMVPNRIRQFPKPPLDPLPPPPNGDDKMDIRVFDLENKERDINYAKEKYGITFQRANVAPGQKVYRLIELREKTGYHSLVTQVLDEDGNALANVDVALYWPDAPDPPDPPTNVTDLDWYRKFVHGLTNVNGDVGPGMGTGAYHGEGEGGPHSVWVRDPNIPSDVCEKLGMLAGTFHDHLDQKFKLMDAGKENGPPPPKEGKFEIIGKQVFEYRPKNQIIIEVAGERDFKDVQAYIKVTGSDVVMGPFDPASLDHFDLDTTYDPGEEEERTFLITLKHIDGTVLGGPWGFLYHSNIPTEWRATVKWEIPVVPPDDKDLLEVAKSINAYAADAVGLLGDLKAHFLGEEPVKSIFLAKYYPNVELQGEPALTREEEKIDHFWGPGSPGTPIPVDFFSAEWTGKFPFEDGTYEFIALVDDGFQLSIDGIVAMEYWKDQPPTEYKYSIALVAGLHSIHMKYYERAGGATCRLEWRKV